MLDPSHPIAQLLQEDSRYSFQAYAFVFESLNYAQNVLGMGVDIAAEETTESRKRGEPEAPKHVSGGQLCEAVRLFALDQFGYMAKPVLNSWGIHVTSDFGEIVFNLIQIGQMRKTSRDMRKDFDDVYDFDVAFRKEFKSTCRKASKLRARIARL